MKKSFAFLFIMASMLSCSEIDEQEILSTSPLQMRSIDSNINSKHYYWCDGVKIPLTVNERKSFIVAETSKQEKISRKLEKKGGKIKNKNTKYDYESIGIDVKKKKAKLQTDLTAFTLDDTKLDTTDLEDVVYAAPYFKAADGADIGITNTLEVRLAGDTDLAKFEELAKEYKVEVLGQNQFDQSIYSLACTKKSKGNALEIANLLYESGGFEYVSPEFIIEFVTDYTNPNDPYFSSQWNLLNGGWYTDISYSTSSNGDINYVEAAALTSPTNLSNIVVAVIDNGIDKNHPDLPLYTGGYDAHTGKTPSQIYGDHGTACAGIIGATANNGIGVAGIASGVKILPISACFKDDGERLGITPSTTTHFANAIRYAANNGADIISNSWGSESSSPMTNINDAIKYAQGSAGRNGKGCVVVFCSGNEESSNLFQPQADAPATTLIVGAMDRMEERSYYSNYGIQLDVVAPGDDILTTGLQGSYTYFTGTSAAAPHAAGVAALMLSINPELTQQQVSDMIISTARKVGGYSYGLELGRPVGSSRVSWNNEVGHGLVDAYIAVEQLYFPSTTYSGPDMVMENTTNVQYKAPSVLGEFSFSRWTFSGPGQSYMSYPSTASAIDDPTLICTTFQQPGTFVLGARYEKPNGGTIELSKTITTMPIPPSPITVTRHPDDPQNVVICHAPNKPYSGFTTVTYEWSVNWKVDTSSNTKTLTVNVNRHPNYTDRMIIECRAIVRGLYSDYASTYVSIP